MSVVLEEGQGRKEIEENRCHSGEPNIVAEAFWVVKSDLMIMMMVVTMMMLEVVVATMSRFFFHSLSFRMIQIFY